MKKREETIHKTLQMPKLDLPCEAKVTKSHDEDHADEDSLDQWEKLKKKMKEARPHVNAWFSSALNQESLLHTLFFIFYFFWLF